MQITCKTEPILSVFDLSELVYLTADSDTVLLELDPAKVSMIPH